MTWAGAEYLREYLVPIADLRIDGWSAGDLDSVTEGLARDGQVRPVLVDDGGLKVVAREHIVEGARQLGWTHIAVRRESSEEVAVSRDQLSLIEEVERQTPDDRAAIEALTKPAGWKEADEAAIAEINDASANPEAEWVGLPEFVRGDDPFRVVISCETEADRDALFDALGIATIHKGTRGTLSAWWPDRPKKDLSSLRFVVAEQEHAA